MTVSISSLQSELLNLLNGTNDAHDDNPLAGGSEVPIENVLEASNDAPTNSDLKGGDNIQGMLENILTGGNKKSNDVPEDKNTSESTIIENILLEDEKSDKEQSKSPEDAINEILIQGSGDDKIEGGDKEEKQSDAEEFDVLNESDDDTQSKTSDTSSEDESEPSDDSDYSDNEFVEVIKEFTAAPPTLTGGLVGSSNPSSRIRIVNMFPYILNT